MTVYQVTCKKATTVGNVFCRLDQPKDEWSRVKALRAEPNSLALGGRFKKVDIVKDDRGNWRETQLDVFNS